MWPLGQNHWLSRPRSALGLLCLFNLLFLIVGVPLPKSRQKDKSSAYPCMDHACGCMNAEQCWRGCCCFTREEKLAWAKENGVTPPAFVLAQAEAEEQHEHACCSSKTDHKKPHECSECKKTESTASNNQEASTCCHEQGYDHEQENADPVELTWVVTLQALKCHGDQGWNWLASIIVIDLTERASVSVQAAIQECVVYQNEAIQTISHLPAVPPPRCL